MRVVGLKVLKNKLAEYVRLAEAGETILISDRDQVVAELSPPSPARAHEVADAVLAHLMRTGLISPALRGPGPAPRAALPVAPLATLLAELAADRDERSAK